MARILVIEDEETVLRLVTRILASAGHEFAEASEGKDGLRMYEASTFVLVITDINMPGMDGLEFIRALRKFAPDVPIIAISGGGLMPKELLLDNASLLGAFEVISKPFGLAELLGAVDRALGADQD